MSRQQQIDALRAANPYAQPAREDPANSYDVGLKLPSGQIVRVRTTLPEKFPEAAPVISIVERNTTHPWLDEHQRVVRSPDVGGWTHDRNLGQVLMAVMQQFGTRPPVFTPATPPPPFPAPSGPLAPRPAAGGPMGGGGSAGGGGGGGGWPTGGGAASALGQQQQMPAASPALARQESLGHDVTLEDLALSTRAGGTRGGGGAGLGAVPTHHTAIGPLPAAFPALEGMTPEALAMLDDDEAARTAFLASHETVRLFEGMAASQREATARQAAANVEAAERLRAATAAVERAQATARAREAELAALLARQRAALERLSAPRLVRELEAAAAALDALACAASEAFIAEPAAYTPNDGSSSAASPAVGAAAGAGAADPRVRRFCDEFLALRRRFHAARGKAHILQAVGCEARAAAGGSSVV